MLYRRASDRTSDAPAATEGKGQDPGEPGRQLRAGPTPLLKRRRPDQTIIRPLARARFQGDSLGDIRALFVSIADAHRMRAPAASRCRRR
jgi:hypothetical protein